MDTKGQATKRQPIHKFPYIAEEIVRRVLPNLPVESLIRFRCVAKQWSCWISQDKSRKKLMVLSLDESTYPPASNLFGTIDRTAVQLEVIYTPPPWVGAEHISIYGSCNGLLAIAFDGYIYLWNPFIGRYNHILSINLYSEYYVAISGLCFDSDREDYKVVLAWKHSSPDWGVQDVEVGSAKHKSWTEIQEFPYELESGKTGPLMNDRLHWVVSPQDDEGGRFLAPDIVVCFDPKTDEFESFSMPDPLNGTEGNRILGLGVLDGCLCMVCGEESASYEGPVQVLVMKDYGVKESWTVMFRIKQYLRYGIELVPCFYTGEGNIRMLMMFENSWDGGCISVYKTTEDMFMEDIALPSKSIQAIVYEETLVVPM